MNNLFKLGRVVGFISRIISNGIIFRINIFLCGYYTSRISYKFKEIGFNPQIRKDVVVLKPENICIGSNVIIDNSCVIESWYFSNISDHSGVIIIGDNCAFGEYTHLSAANRIEIGDGLLTGRNVLITDNSHGLTNGDELNISPRYRKIQSKGPVFIGNNVWLGDKVSVMPGVSIGDGVIVAANAVVTHDIPAYSVAAGVPAKVIKNMERTI